jgi:predicted DNA-binding protein
MKTTTVRNFHIPLPEQVYNRLRELAQRQHRPATQLARQAVEYWLEEQERLTLHEEIAAYAARQAGSADDLDEELETAGLELLEDQEPRP